MCISTKNWSLLMILVIRLSDVFVQAVTVNPLCPTNKIAPHKRFADWDQPRERTFGLFQHILAPNHHNYYQNDAPDDLQEPLQSDDPDDCGEIEDYDENDLSSVTKPQSQRRKEYGNKDFASHGGFHRPMSLYPHANRPPRPNYNPVRPPYWSGGYFENNNYRPQSFQRPSDKVKPVNENRPEINSYYDPQVVGGPLGHVVGFSPVRPTRYPKEDFATTPHNGHIRFPASTESPSRYPYNRPSPRRFDKNTIVGSFIDLFSK